MEDWKDIPGYEGIYQASNEGRIRSAPDKTTYTERHGVRHWKSRILKTKRQKPPHRQDERVSLWLDGKPKWFLVARLVAMAWCNGYQDGFTVNHIDGNCLNNNANNLEWVSLADNIKLGFKTGLYKAATKRCALYKSDGFYMEFDSLASASRYIGRRNGYISDVLNEPSEKAISSNGEVFFVKNLSK